MTRVALLEADDRHPKTAGSSRMGINPMDTRDAELVEIIPYARRPDDREEATLLVGRVVRHQGACQYRI